ncbi:thioesterase superfamily protein [Striga asiatica]|uniref:Thioesterase superfamily protein n=1 Tax=Striga asiatica TaxID=4170 RepID=A0A5A7PU46_STRAF|nr:thioesterase superfamily protein [Striga asiatica]
MLHYNPSTHSFIIPKLQIRNYRSPNFPTFSCRFVRENYNGLVLDKNRDDKGMKWYHEMKLEVRDYECNRYGVVNNAVYANYCQHGQFRLSEMLGLTAAVDVVVLKELSLKYIAPLRSGDRFLLFGCTVIISFSSCQT